MRVALVDAAGAENVKVLVDVCAIRHHVRAEVMALLEATQFSVYSTSMGKTAVSEQWPRYGGVSVWFLVLGFLYHWDMRHVLIWFSK